MARLRYPESIEKVSKQVFGKRILTMEVWAKCENIEREK